MLAQAAPQWSVSGGPPQQEARGIVVLNLQFVRHRSAGARRVSGRLTGAVCCLCALLWQPPGWTEDTVVEGGATLQSHATTDEDALPGIPLPAPPKEAPAQKTDAPIALQTITVTATKREAEWRSVPASIGVIDGETLEDLSARGLSDYLQLVPGVALLDRGVDGDIPVIRGITTSAAALRHLTTQLTVGIYIGDMPYTDLYLPFSAPDLNAFDLERVEVLKGPQGTLFGSGALSGAIRYLMNPAELDRQATKLRLTLSTTPYSESLSSMLGVAFNQPLFDNEAALRLVGTVVRDAGRIDEIDRGPDIDAGQQHSARLLGRWSLNSRLDLSGFVYDQQGEQENFGHADNPRDFIRQFGATGYRRSGFSGANLVARYAFDEFDLFSSSNFVRKKVRHYDGTSVGIAPFPEDPDGDGGENGTGTEDTGNPDTLTTDQASRTRSLFQELRLLSPQGGAALFDGSVSLEWLIGLAYQRSGQDHFAFQDTAGSSAIFNPFNDLGLLPVGSPLGPISGSREASLLYAEVDTVASETAVFGEATAGIGQHWELTLGLRAFRTKMVAEGFLSGAQTVVFTLGETQADVDRVVRSEGLNPKIALRYLFSENLQFYGLAAKGFQFGGIQLNPPAVTLSTTAPQAFEPYDSSTLWNFELGLRSEFFNRRLQWDITLFHLDWKDLQISVRTPIFPFSEELGLSLGYIENIGRARSQGLETSVTLRLRPGLQLSSSATWMSARTTEDFDSVSGFVAAGTRLPGSPRLQWTNQIHYQPAMRWARRWPLRIELTHSYIGGSYSDLHYFRDLGDYHNWDLGLGLDNRRGRQLKLSILNLSDARGVSAVTGSASGGSRDVGYFFIRPRTLMLSLGLEF